MAAEPTLSIRLFSTDLDGTLLGNPESGYRFKHTWEATDAATRPLLVYNSGRSGLDIRPLITARTLPEPDYILGGVGTELFDPKKRPELAGFGAQFGEGWD